MNVLKTYYGIVISLDEFLDKILSEEIRRCLNLIGVFSDIILVGAKSSIENFYEKKMTESTKSFEDIIKMISAFASEHEEIDSVYDFEFFNNSKFKYLYELIGEDYFCQLLSKFQIYHLDRVNILHLKLGTKFSDNAKVNEDLSDLNAFKLMLDFNQEFCKSNAKIIGILNAHQPERFEYQGLNIVKLDNEVNNLSKFLSEHGESGEIGKFLRNEKRNYVPSKLLDQKMSGKLHFYWYQNNNQTINRQRIYFNQEFDLSRQKFFHQFENIDATKIFEKIFKSDLELVHRIYENKVYKNLIDFFKIFIDKHQRCDFDKHLRKSCPGTKEISRIQDGSRYQPGVDLFEIDKQDQVARYIKLVFEDVLTSDIIGRENFISVLKFFNLIPFQNQEIKLYFSSFYNNIYFKELDWLNKLSIQDKIRIMDLIIKWLTDYVLDLLHISFFISKEERLRFYRYTYWTEIRNRQLMDWQSFGYISLNKNPADLVLGDEYLNTKVKIIPTFDYMELHSEFDNETDNRMKLVGSVLNLICINKPCLFKNEIDFFNKFKRFHENIKLLQEGPFGFKFDLEDILPEIKQDILLQVVSKNLNMVGERNFELKKIIAYQKPKRIKKQEIYYLNLDDERDLMHNLRLNGIHDLEDSLIYHEEFRQTGDTNFIFNLIFKFIRKNRLRLNVNDHIIMKKGIPFNHQITNKLTMLYINDLVESLLPTLIERVNQGDNGVFYCCSESSILILTDSEEDAKSYFYELFKSLPMNGLKIKKRSSFSTIHLDDSDLASNMCCFKRFSIEFQQPKPLVYKHELFNIRNVKSSHSFHLFENLNDFKEGIIDKFLKDFRVFNLDASSFPFNEMTYILFAHFGLFAIQVYYFFDNAHHLKLDQNPQLLFEIIFDLIESLLKNIKLYDQKIHEFYFNLDFHTIAWLLVQAFLLTWSKHQRYSEIKLLEKLDDLLINDVKDEDLRSYDLKSGYQNLFKEVDFCISRSRRRSRSRSRSRRKRRSRSRSRSRSRRKRRSRSRSRSRKRKRSTSRSRSRSRRRRRSRSRKRSYRSRSRSRRSRR